MAKTELNDREFAEIYDRFVSRIDAEDALIDDRVQWLLVSQGLLFTAYGFAVSGQGGEPSPAVHDVAELLPWLGLSTSLLIWLSTAAAFATAANCRNGLVLIYRSATTGESRARHRRIAAFPQANRKAWHFYTGFVASLSLPLAFALGWAILAS